MPLSLFSRDVRFCLMIFFFYQEPILYFGYTIWDLVGGEVVGVEPKVTFGSEERGILIHMINTWKYKHTRWKKIPHTQSQNLPRGITYLWTITPENLNKHRHLHWGEKVVNTQTILKLNVNLSQDRCHPNLPHTHNNPKKNDWLIDWHTTTNQE